jgi:hypothetical protein
MFDIVLPSGDEDFAVFVNGGGGGDALISSRAAVQNDSFLQEKGTFVKDVAEVSSLCGTHKSRCFQVFSGVHRARNPKSSGDTRT